MGPPATIPFRRVAFVLLSMLLGVLVVGVGFEIYNWQRRQADLEHRTGLILDRSIDVANEARIAVRMVNALKTEPCTSADIAAMNVIVSRTSYLVDVGRIVHRTILCDTTGKLVDDARLHPPDRISTRGAEIWLSTPLRGDWRVRVTASALNGVIVYSRPTASSDLYRSLGDAVATVSPVDTKGQFTSSVRSSRLVGAEYSAPTEIDPDIDHIVHHCNMEFELCVSASEHAQWGLPGVPLAGKFALLAGGMLLGLIAHAVVGSWLTTRRTLYRRLRRAIRRDQISVHYQPMVCLNTTEVLGFEALARWRVPGLDDVPPDVFIPLAETSGLLGALTERVVARTFGEMAAILADRRNLHVSINVAVQSLLSDEFQPMLDRLAHRHGVNRRSIVVEVTERETGDVARIGHAVRALRDAGYRVFLDDFGTGYSSLAYLASLPIDTIKLDKLFSNSVGTSLVGTLVLREICRMMATLGLNVVFEGIETTEQAGVLEELAPGAMGQGWLYGRPVPVADLVLPPIDGPPA